MLVMQAIANVSISVLNEWLKYQVLLGLMHFSISINSILARRRVSQLFLVHTKYQSIVEQAMDGAQHTQPKANDGNGAHEATEMTSSLIV